MSPDKKVPEPPQPPKVKKRVNLSLGQRIGFPILLLLPLLAFFGIFGVTFERVESQGELLELNVKYADRTRLRAPHLLLIEVTNLTDSSIAGVTVVIDREYVDSFSDVTFTPEPSEITPDEYRVELGTIPGSSSRLVSADMTPSSYWRQEAVVSAAAEGQQPVEVEFATFVFP